MGRTIPSFRIAAEMERVKWRPFRSLLHKKDRKLFDEMFSYVRFYNSACMMVARPFVFQSVMISILFHHYKQLRELRGKIKRKDFQTPAKIIMINGHITIDNWIQYQKPDVAKTTRQLP
jgi:hypothetical protein